MYQIPLKVNVLGSIFSNVTGLYLQSLLKIKHLLRYIFNTPILRIPFSLKKHVVPNKMVWLEGGGFKELPLSKLVTIVYLENHIN